MDAKNQILTNGSRPCPVVERLTDSPAFSVSQHQSEQKTNLVLIWYRGY
jgi:hypothetical protein